MEAANGGAGAQVIEINVGGKVFTTLRSTLAWDPKSRLARAAAIGEVASDAAGRPFIDRDPQHFALVLEYLRGARTGAYRLPYNLSDDTADALMAEAEFYGLNGLRALLRAAAAEDASDPAPRPRVEYMMHVSDTLLDGQKGGDTMLEPEYEDHSVFNKDKRGNISYEAQWRFKGIRTVSTPCMDALNDLAAEGWRVQSIEYISVRYLPTSKGREAPGWPDTSDAAGLKGTTARPVEGRVPVFLLMRENV